MWKLYGHTGLVVKTSATGSGQAGHKLIFQIVMYTTPRLGYSGTQLVTQVT